PSLLRYSHACTPARLLVFFFPAPSPPALSTLSLHDALPISGTPVHFRITLPRDLSCSAARLVVEQEGRGTSVLDMFWCGMNGNNREWWECHFTPEAPGLCFYYFEARTCRGIQRISRDGGGTAVFGGNDRWQLTVYDKDFTTPS